MLSYSFQTGSLKKLKKLQILYWFRLVQIESSDFILEFQISNWIQIDSRFVSDFFLKKIVKNSNVRLVQIGSDWLENESPWIFTELFHLWKFPENADQFSIFLYYNCLLVGREHTWPMGLGLSDFVLSREILLNGISELRPCNEIYQKVQYIAQTTFNFLWRRFFETQIFRRFPKISYIKTKARDRITQYVVAPHTPRRSTFV